jgi:FlaA1/EpsC-like NDP-sugar epimerase
LTETWSFLLERPEMSFPRGILEAVLNGRKIVITGAAGSVGSALSLMVGRFAPEQLVLVDNHEASLFRLGRELADLGVTPRPRLVLADIRDRRKLHQTLRQSGADVVFHLAAYKQVPLGESNVDQVLDVNILGTANVVEASRELHAATVVYPSTDKAVRPSSLYGASKRVVERFLQANAIHSFEPAIRVVRLVNVFGTQGSVVELFAGWIAQGRPLSITDPAMDRYWITMNEATQLLVAAASRPSFEGIHLLDCGEPVRITRTAEAVFRRLRPQVAEPPFQIVGSRPGERLHEYLHFPEEKLRPTELPGLLVAELPDPTTSATDWGHALKELRETMFDLEPSELRDWAFRAAVSGSDSRLVGRAKTFDPGRER